MIIVLTLMCIAAYALTLWFANHELATQLAHPHRVAIVACVTLALHIALISQSAFHASGDINLNLRNTLVIISALCSGAALLLHLIQRNLGLILSVAAFSILALAISSFLPQSSHSTQTQMMAHAGLSFSAYVILGLAACHALVVSYVHRHMRNKTSLGIVRNLPPMIELEKLLFITIGLGFVLLTLSLITGFLHLDDMFAQRVAHKTLFSLVSWLLFAWLLVGRLVYGWRGKKAIRWTLIAFGLLCVAFLGTQFIKEVVLR